MSGHPVFAWCYSKVARYSEDRGVREHRVRLLAGATGRIVEIGAGTGLNLPLYPPGVSEVLATEPDPHMFKRLSAALPGASVPARSAEAPAGSLPVADGWADAVVATLVLCSVADVSAALVEARRVLQPDGRLLFYEHVRSLNPRLAAWQDRLATPWGWVSAGCHPNRETVAAIESAGFVLEDVDRFDIPGEFLSTPHVLGSALRG